MSTQDPNQLAVAAEGELLDGWVMIVAKANSQDGDSEGKYFNFVSKVQGEGACCGFTSSSLPEQNLQSSSCTFELACEVFLLSYIQDWVLGTLFKVYVILTAAQMCLLIGFCVTISRIRPIPDKRTENGWVYKTIHN